MSPIRVTRTDPPQPPEPYRAINVGMFRIAIPHEDAPARQHLDFAALSAFAREAHPDAFGNTALVDAAIAAARAYLELYPDAAQQE